MRRRRRRFTLADTTGIFDGGSVRTERSRRGRRLERALVAEEVKAFAELASSVLARGRISAGHCQLIPVRSPTAAVAASTPLGSGLDIPLAPAFTRGDGPRRWVTGRCRQACCRSPSWRSPASPCRCRSYRFPRQALTKAVLLVMPLFPIPTWPPLGSWLKGLAIPPFAMAPP